MVRQLEAIYRDGVLKPLEPMTLRENEHVRLTIEQISRDEASPAETGLNGNSRHEEFEWLRREGSLYQGQWVALEGSRLLAHGDKLSAVSSAAKAAGVAESFFISVPDSEDLPFAGW